MTTAEVTLTRMMECERLECSCTLVEAVARFWWPRDMTRVTSSSVSTASVTIPGS